MTKGGIYVHIHACCFTGHRQISPAEQPLLVRETDAAIAAVYGMGCRDFYAGGAIGFDTLAASRVLLFRQRHPDVHLYLILPCRDQCRSWSEEEICTYRDLQNASDGYRYIRDAYDPHVMRDRNAALVAESDACIAYLLRPISGAAQTVRMAKKAGHLVINLADEKYRRCIPKEN